MSRRCFSQTRNPYSTAPPPRISQTTGDSPSHVGASGFGSTNPQVPDAQDPVDDEAEAERRQAGADEVEARTFLGLGVSAVRRFRSSTTPMMSTSPTKT